MKNAYSRKASVTYWVIQSEDLKKVHDFFKARMDRCDFDSSPSMVSITLEFLSGDTRTYHTFKEFEDDRDNLKELHMQGETVNSLNISASKNGNGKRLHIWLAINSFSYITSRSINISGEDSDGSLRDFVVGIEDEANRILKGFIPDERTINKLKAMEGVSGQGVIIFDIFGTLKEKLRSEIPEMTIEITRGERLSRFLREHWLPTLLIFLSSIVGAVMAVITLIG